MFEKQSLYSIPQI